MPRDEFTNDDRGVLKFAHLPGLSFRASKADEDDDDYKKVELRGAIEADERLKHDKQMPQMEAGARAQVVFESGRRTPRSRQACPGRSSQGVCGEPRFGMGAAMVQLLDGIQLPSLIANEPH